MSDVRYSWCNEFPWERLRLVSEADAILVLGVPVGAKTAVPDLMVAPQGRQANLLLLVDAMVAAGHPHAALRLL